MLRTDWSCCVWLGGWDWPCCVGRWVGGGGGLALLVVWVGEGRGGGLSKCCRQSAVVDGLLSQSFLLLAHLLIAVLLVVLKLEQSVPGQSVVGQAQHNSNTGVGEEGQRCSWAAEIRDAGSGSCIMAFLVANCHLQQLGAAKQAWYGLLWSNCLL